jgi:hypothetical protein
MSSRCAYKVGMMPRTSLLPRCMMDDRRNVGGHMHQCRQGAEQARHGQDEVGRSRRVMGKMRQGGAGETRGRRWGMEEAKKSERVQSISRYRI